jgi:hypothetical protein
MSKSDDDDQSFVIIGSINQDDKAIVFESYLAPSDLPSSEYPKESEYTIAFLDNTGATLDEKPFTVSFKNPDLPLPLLSTSFSIVCPFPKETESIEIRHSAKVLIHLEKSDNAPSISNVRVMKAEDSESDMIIEWEASDPDSDDDLTYSVSYSIDQGKSFIQIEGGIRKTKLILSTLGLGGSESALIKVIVSDGFHTSEAISEPFFLPTKPPVATILWPRSGDNNNFGSDEVLLLRGIGLDPEDGILKGDNLEWFLKESKGDKTLGKGDELAIKKPLPAGKHTIRLVATDKEGKSGDDERVIYVDHKNA